MDPRIIEAVTNSLPDLEKALEKAFLVLRTTLPFGFSKEDFQQRVQKITLQFPSRGFPLHFFSNQPTDSPRLFTWMLSRLCLIEALENLLCLPTFPGHAEISVGISHTDQGLGKCAAVAIAAFGESGTQIGVDLEFSDRRVSERVYFRVSDAEERDMGMTPLECWVIKEAAFKAAEGAAAFVSEFQVTERLQSPLDEDFIRLQLRLRQPKHPVNRADSWNGEMFRTGEFLVGIVRCKSKG